MQDGALCLVECGLPGGRGGARPGDRFTGRNDGRAGVLQRSMLWVGGSTQEGIRSSESVSRHAVTLPGLFGVTVCKRGTSAQGFGVLGGTLAQVPRRASQASAPFPG